MRGERGFTLVELMIVLGMIGLLAAVAVPVFMGANSRSAVFNGSEQVGAAIRQMRLKAISQNATFRVAFDCPAADQLRGLIMTGDPAVDDAAGRCSDTQDGDTGVVDLPSGVSYDTGGATSLQVTGRGVYTAIGGAIPLTVTVTDGVTTRTLTVSATGQITFTNVE